MLKTTKIKIASFLTLAAVTVPFAQAQPNGIRHVLLISIDGMHALDFLNCTQGVPGVNGGAPYCPNILALKQHGVNYTAASTSEPSDSFPGLMALVTGGSPRSVGAFYDVAFDRALDGPTITTGNGNAAANCTPGAPATGYTTEYDEGIDIDQTKLNGGAPAGVDGGVQSIDPRKLDRDPAHGCAPVFPWNFVRTNSIYGVIHAAGGYTAWSDKHPSYSAVSGHSNTTTPINLDDYYAPEINSAVVPLTNGNSPVITPLGAACAPVRDPAQTGAWTDSFENIQCYDTLKVNAVLNEIKGLTHDGKKKARVPSIFGMNFQVVSVGQKLIEAQATGNPITGGYLDAFGTPSPSLLNEIQFVDTSIGEWVNELRAQGLEQSTMIVLSAKHGQSPIDPTRYKRNGSPNTPADVIASLLAPSESNPNGIGPTQDDVALLWLQISKNYPLAVEMLEAQTGPLGIGEIFAGPAIPQLFNPVATDSRTPDILITPNVGVTYSNSKAKQAEHGGFSHDDTNAVLFLFNPEFAPATITAPVTNMQVAPTILQALGLNPGQLDAVKQEGTAVLPGLSFGSSEDGNSDLQH